MPRTKSKKVEEAKTEAKITASSEPEQKSEKVAEKSIEKVIEKVTEKTIRHQEIEAIKAEEMHTVRGRFRFYECPGGATMVHVRKYKGVPDFRLEMRDGEIYEIPLFVARFLNGCDALAKKVDCKINTCSYPVHAWAWPSGGSIPNPGQVVGNTVVPLLSVGKRVRRVGFESLEFDQVSRSQAPSFSA